MLKHYRGNEANYKCDEINGYAHKDGIYFATDTHKILMNGDVYGSSAGSSEDITTTEDITISGGPLAAEFTNLADSLTELPEDWKTSSGGYKIPKNSTLQDVLRNLFCIEKWHIPTITQANFNPYLSDSTVSGWPTTLQEVGTTITIGTITAGAINSGQSDATIGDFLYGGYYTQAEGGTKQTTKPAAKSMTDVELTQTLDSNEQPLTWERELSVSVANVANSVTWNNGANDSSISVKSTPDQHVEIPGFSFNVEKGTKSITCVQSVINARYVGISQAWPKYWVISSLGNRSTDKHTSELDSQEITRDVPTSKTTTKSITGVYPIYTNGIVLRSTDKNTAGAYGVDGYNGKHKLSLVNYKEANYKTFYIGFGAQDSSKDVAWYFYLPNDESLSIKEAKGYNPTESGSDKFVIDYTFTKQSGTVSIGKFNYDVWKCSGNAGSNNIRIKLN